MCNTDQQIVLSDLFTKMVQTAHTTILNLYFQLLLTNTTIFVLLRDCARFRDTSDLLMVLWYKVDLFQFKLMESQI